MEAIDKVTGADLKTILRILAKVSTNCRTFPLWVEALRRTVRSMPEARPRGFVAGSTFQRSKVVV